MINAVPKALVFKNDDEVCFESGIFSISSVLASENVVLLRGWFIFPNGTEEEGEIEFDFEKEIYLIEFFHALFEDKLKRVKATFYFVNDGLHEVLNVTVDLKIQENLTIETRYKRR